MEAARKVENPLCDAGVGYSGAETLFCGDEMIRELEFGESDWVALRWAVESLTAHDAGVPLLVGTDTPHAFVVPGFAVHDEIQFFVNAGLTPYEAISAATANVGKFLSKPKTVGVVAPGAQADLILLKDNPLEDVKNLSRPAGVMYHGKWLPQEELQRGLDDMVAKYKKKENKKDNAAAHTEHGGQRDQAAKP